MTTFNLHYEISVDIESDDLWPDGDGPDYPTVADVEALIEAQGGTSRVLDDWCLATHHDKIQVSEIKPWVPGVVEIDSKREYLDLLGLGRVT